MPPDSLPISETFTSIQGEGRLTGVPSFFIRLSGCNLRCVWCDTPYASWNPDGAKEPVEAIVHRAQSSGVRHAVLTGGEPMIFPRIVPLAEALRSAGMHITVETAGTVFRRLPCDLMSISPKLANSTPVNDPRDPDGAWARRHEERRLNLSALQALIDGYDDVQLKFVVAAPDDLAEIDDLLAQLTGWSPPDVMLMPEGTAVPDPESVRWAVDACLRRGWRYCHRLHIELFGNVRGT